VCPDSVHRVEEEHRMAQRIVIDTTDVKKRLESHIRTAEDLVERTEGDQRTRAKMLLNSLRSAQHAMLACCCDEPTQGCPFDV
jgi:septal ring factor EnvC (AmiA/AmiB activator)